ncbi:MAG: serine/threonine protein kinase [Fimbriimonadaceae bacterium]|nr:serine/threonine protein kinase [Fimbriimonadaceae bacterium]
MSPERYQQIRELFLRLRDLPTPEREAELTRACVGDAALRHEVERLLAASGIAASGTPEADAKLDNIVGRAIEQAAGEFVAGGPALGFSHLRIGEQRGDMIGPYRLLEVIGEGGFGVVWLAERRDPMVQRVALKIIKPGMDSKAVVARFEQERQALAVMDHPNVARIFDGGVTPTGRPYFVMEHVQGEPITTFCDRHTYTLRQRLELFIPVCEAVQHAHMKGIIHRDLKPSNILVTLKDGEAIPKVIDFGVAKAISQTLTDKTIFTETGQLLGTPEYMSPEQAEMGRLDIDTRTDVYSLGVVLYELLTGLLPFDAKELRSKGYAEIQRIIREVDPPTPSKRLTQLSIAECVDIAKRRGTQCQTIQTELRHRLECVASKAMSKSRDARYETALDVARDVRAYLDGEAISARRESMTELMHRRLLQHRRLALAVATAAAISLTAGILWLTHSYRHVRADAAAYGRANDLAFEHGFELGLLAATLGDHLGTADASSDSASAVLEYYNFMRETDASSVEQVLVWMASRGNTADYQRLADDPGTDWNAEWRQLKATLPDLPQRVDDSLRSLGYCSWARALPSITSSRSEDAWYVFTSAFSEDHFAPQPWPKKSPSAYPRRLDAQYVTSLEQARRSAAAIFVPHAGAFLVSEVWQYLFAIPVLLVLAAASLVVRPQSSLRSILIGGAVVCCIILGLGIPYATTALLTSGEGIVYFIGVGFATAVVIFASSLSRLWIGIVLIASLVVGAAADAVRISLDHQRTCAIKTVLSEMN